MKNKILVALFAAACCTGAYAADEYTIDPSHTAATFAFKHFGYSTFQGKIPAQSGTIVLDRAQKAGTVDIVFNIKSIATGVPKFDDHLRSKDFFDAENNATATFKSNQVVFAGDAPSSVTGDLTIKGITKPVTLKITSFHCADHPMKKTPACGADATAQIKRSDFGLGQYAPHVSDELPLTIEVEAAKK
jgi:polyisoprenoid-binding protein YceI